jgi:hypothetical protein
MIPHHIRVAAFDDNKEHLEKIIIGLGKAGFWAMPFFYDAGVFVPELPEPFPGIRLVFSDIHMGTLYGSNSKTYASNIINGLKNIVKDGPYGLIFWSQYPGDADSVTAEIKLRGTEAGVTLPIFYGVLDKNSVMTVADGNGFDAEKLRVEILEAVKIIDVLAIAMSWDERVSQAAAQVTNHLYHLAKPQNDLVAWTHLLAYLGQEAIGFEKAKLNPCIALDNAMLPILEDLLADYVRSNDPNMIGNSISEVLTQSESGLNIPDQISPADLNTHYLIEKVNSSESHIWERGMVTKMGGGFRDSGEFCRYFGMSARELIKDEFLKNSSLESELFSKSELHLVELSAECDQVQGKVAVHRYLLALLVPSSIFTACSDFDKKSKKFKGKLANDSLLNLGAINLKDYSESCYLLISTRRFMILAPGMNIDGVCVFRLRKMIVDELAHKYTSHSNRPGVMRFK